MDIILLEKVREDIKDKARGFCAIQQKVIIKTLPSTRFPTGAKYEGYIFDVTNNQIIFDDTFKDIATPLRIHIFLSELSSPADIWEAKDN